MNPSLLNPLFRYTPAAQTDIRKTIRREQKRLAKQREVDAAHNRILKVVSR